MHLTRLHLEVTKGPLRWVLVALLSALVPGLWSATCTWSGNAGSGLWSDAGNWSPSLPGAGDEVVLGIGAAVNRTQVDTISYASLTCLGNVLLSGQVLTLSRQLHVIAGRVTISCGVHADGDLTVQVDGGGHAELAAAVELSAHGLSLGGEGVLILNGTISGSGSLTVLGPGEVELHGMNPFSGDTTLDGGECWVESDVLVGSGPFGTSLHPVVINGGCLVLDAPRFVRSLQIGDHGGQLDARTTARVLEGDILVTPFRDSGLLGTYLNRSLRDITEDDWRTRGEVTGTRLDEQVNFPDSAFGTPVQQHHFAIQGSSDNWDNFSVQWDGFIRIEHDGTHLFTSSDDGSRVWLDLNHDGKVQALEWGGNGWGSGHGATIQQVQGPLAAGIYPIRIQYEEGGGQNSMQLRWDDPSGGANPHPPVLVPAMDLLQGARFAIGGDDYGEERGQNLTIHGRIRGDATLMKIGSSSLTIDGECAELGDIQVVAGTLILGRGVGGSHPAALTIADGAHLLLHGRNAIRDIQGSGSLQIDQGDLQLETRTSSTFAGDIAGSGSLTKFGPGVVTLSGGVTCTVHCDGGMMMLADGRLLAAVPLMSPMNTQLEIPNGISGARSLDGSIIVPSDAPPHLGYELGLGDIHGHWCQCPGESDLTPGTHPIHLVMADRDYLRGEPWSTRWESLDTRAARTVFYLWSPVKSRATVHLELHLQALGDDQDLTPHLQELVCPTPARQTGERMEWRFRPEPFPHNPYDPDDYQADAIITQPDGTTVSVPAFFDQDMVSHDRGDREDVVPTGEEAFVVRFRPRLPGAYQVVLHSHWAGSPTVSYPLRTVEVRGRPWDRYVRVDSVDHRFFTCGGEFCWPIGLNIRSVNDVRSQAQLGTMITPDRGTLAYHAYLTRLAAAGGTAVEIWMAPWNLGLEWRGDWNGFYGQGRYNQLNAWRLDRILDEAASLGIHVNLVVSNHGQASEGADHEWENSPYNVGHGGRLKEAAKFFTDPWALRGQEAYRRYLIARFADHPAILGWKLWSEVNLTSAGAAVVTWHENATARWHALDIYHHPVTTHWAGDYGAADRRVVALPGLDYVCIDAYQSGRLLAQLLTDGVDNPSNGLGHFKKPVLVTECGGNWNAAPAAEIISEHASAAWASLVSGNSGAAMLWWYEFVDQHDLWLPYHAIHQFIQGEDLRGLDADSIALTAESSAGTLWARAWSRPGRMLGYVLDGGWEQHGTEAASHSGAHVHLPAIAAGACSVEWWDCDQGLMRQRVPVISSGGELVLDAPVFRRHIAFKLSRSTP